MRECLGRCDVCEDGMEGIIEGGDPLPSVCDASMQQRRRLTGGTCVTYPPVSGRIVVVAYREEGGYEEHGGRGGGKHVGQKGECNKCLNEGNTK